MSKITLNNVGSLIDATTAANTINANTAVIQTAFDNTLSRDGTVPNMMGSNLDMNSNQILNLPAPVSGTSPARLQDVISNPTLVLTIPPIGTSGATVGLLNTNNTDSGNNVHSGTATFNGTATFGSTATFSAPVTLTSPTLTGPALGTPVSGNLTNCTNIPGAQLAGLGANVLPFLLSPTSANLAAAVTDEVGTGSLLFSASPTMTGTPNIAAATATSLTASGSITTNSPTAAFGFVTGSGGSVAQAISKNTAVTLNKPCGQITTSNSAIAATTNAQFTLNNSLIGATDVLILNHSSGGSLGLYCFTCGCQAGSATITIRNLSGGSLSETLVIQYVLIKGQTS